MFHIQCLTELTITGFYFKLSWEEQVEMKKIQFWSKHDCFLQSTGFSVLLAELFYLTPSERSFSCSSQESVFSHVGVSWSCIWAECSWHCVPLLFSYCLTGETWLGHTELGTYPWPSRVIIVVTFVVTVKAP